MDVRESVQKLLGAKSKVRWIVAIGFVGILLSLVSCLWQGGGDTESAEPANSVSTEEYQQKLQKQVSDMVSQIDGVGTASVMITLENGVENVYANSEKKSTDTQGNASSGQNTNRSDQEQDVVIVDGADGRQALMVTQKEPTVKGVVVVCDGADRCDVVQRVTDAVATSLHIKSNRVCVVKAAAQNQN